MEVVFTDIRMAVMDGLEFLDRLKNERIAQPYKVILSAYDEFHYARQALSLIHIYRGSRRHYGSQR